MYARISLPWLLAPGLLLSACSSSPSPLNPASARADDLRWLWWILFAIATLVLVGVTVLLIWAALRAPSPDEEEREHPFGTRLVWIGGVIIPLLILAYVFALSIAQMARSGNGQADLTIDVIGHQWWWEVRYPSNNVTTANEIHLPVGKRAQVRVSSADVIHGFWVPQLQGKIDAIPGQTNTITLEAAQAGIYRGECLVFCALQHANMNLLVIAEPQEEFGQWLSAQAVAPSASSDAETLQGQLVFLRSACSSCHTIAGTNAAGTAGPNLTHLASRQQLAAGTIPNTPESLSNWVVDPQIAKPGNRMPSESLTSGDLHALLAYLESLK